MITLKARDPHGHKGNYGKILIIAGSNGMAGAAVLCAKGAFRSGAGLVQVSIDSSMFPIIHMSVPEATCVNRDSILDNLSLYQAIIFGPGTGMGSEVSELLHQIIKNYTKTIVIDADGLNILAEGNNKEWLRDTRAKIIITPHIGEAMRFLGVDKEEMNRFTREEIALELYRHTGAIVVLKGHATFVYDGNIYWVNDNGNAGMATAGTGDVLAGIIGSLCGQGYEPDFSAKAGVQIHGLAGDLAKGEFGEAGLMASDLCYYTAKAIQQIMRV